jgi:Chaperone of endosialidase
MKPNSLWLIFFTSLTYFSATLGTEAVVPPPDGAYANFTTAEGTNALLNLTTGIANTGLGWSSLLSVTTGSLNTAVGAGTLALNTADSNTAVGAGALLTNTIGVNNTANGAFALFSNISGNLNTAEGYQALFSNVGPVNDNLGSLNTATGGQALFNNTNGGYNTADGVQALMGNTTGSYNTASGVSALWQNNMGSYNVAFGGAALSSNDGNQNTGIGYAALINNTTADNNTAVGYGALMTNSTGSNNIGVGYQAGLNVTTASHVICIGADGNNVDNTCFIGNIRGATTQNNDAMPVLIDSAGQLGTASSSRRYKTDIKPLNEASKSILALKPVSFRYKVHKDSTPQFGLIAEEVEKVNPSLVVRDKEGQPYSVRYDQVNAMLLNEFLKEHKKVEQLEKEVQTLAAGLQKVSAKLELAHREPQTVLNHQ